MKLNQSQEGEFQEVDAHNNEDQQVSLGSSIQPVIITNSQSKWSKANILVLIGLFFVLVILSVSIFSFKDTKVAQQTKSNKNKLPIKEQSQKIHNQQELDQQRTKNIPQDVGIYKTQNKSDNLAQKNKTQQSSRPKQSEKFLNRSQINKQVTIQPKVLQSTIQLIEKQLEKSMIKQYSYDCLRIETIFHYFNQTEKRFYYRSPYPIYIPSCVATIGQERVTFWRERVQSWNQQRQIIEWGRKYIRKGENVLFDCPECKNYLQIILLAKFVGKFGNVSILNLQENKCLEKTKQINHIDNIGFVDNINGTYQQFDTVISLNEAFFKEEVEKGLLSNLPQKMLLKLSDKNESINILQKIQNNNKSYVNKVYLNNSDCRSTTIPVHPDNKGGFYQLVSKQFSVTDNNQPESLIQLQGSFLREMEEQYQKFRYSVPLILKRKDINKIPEDFPITPQKLKDLAQQDLKKWIGQSQIVEWVKNRVKSNSNVFLEQSNRFNLLSILNIAALIPKGKLILWVPAQKWQIIKKYAIKFAITNIYIQVIDKNKKNYLFTPQFLILDSLTTVKQFFDQNSVQQKKVLAYFDQKIKESNDLLYKLYVNHYIRRVRIKPSFYYGYEIFDNFLFSSENPTGYFEIQKQTYTIYQFWNQGLKQMSSNRKFCIEQITKANTPEVKVVTTTLLPYFILPQEPLHKAYQYLTPVHKSDYLRAYFMHFYGGGYSDIKHIHFDWLPYFEKLFNGPEDKYAIGYHEIFSYDVACYKQEQGEQLCQQMQANYTKLIGYGLFMFKKKSVLSTQWFNRLHKKLDTVYQNLKNHHYMDDRDFRGKKYKINGTEVISNYPLRWAQIGGVIMARAQWQHLEQYHTDLPYVIPVDYR